MSNQRKQIIINEIAFWKQSKMLPEHYCDFLTSLYTGADANETELTADAKKSVIAKEKRAATKKFFFFPVAAILLLIAINFIPIDWIGISIGLVVGVVLTYFGIRLALKNNIAAPLLHVSGALLLLAMTVKLAITYFDGNNNVLYAVVGINSLLWVLLGIWQKLIYFILAGGLGLAVIAGYMMFM